MSEQHLDTLSIVPGAFEGFGPGTRSCDVAGVLVDATWNPALRRFTTVDLARQRMLIWPARSCARRGAIGQRGSSRPTPNAHVSSSSLSPKSGVQSERIQHVCHNERLTGCQNGENTTG